VKKVQKSGVRCPKFRPETQYGKKTRFSHVFSRFFVFSCKKVQILRFFEKTVSGRNLGRFDLKKVKKLKISK